jgi:hypothetical protein
VTYANTNLTFAVPLRNLAAPAQTVAFTIAGAPGGTPYITVKKNGVAIRDVSIAFNNGGGTVTFSPVSAVLMNPGTNTDTVTITVCLDDPFCGSKVIGQPQTFNITYNVTTVVQGTTVTPRVVAANKSGTVILRGKGFASATGARFDAAAGTNFTVVSDSEIRVTYPALTPGSYAVSIDGGMAAFSGALTTVAVPAYTAALVPFPSKPYGIYNVVYDAERNAVLAVVAATDDANNNQLVKFAYNGGAWRLASTTTIAGLQDIAFSPDGRTLIAATSSQLVELDPATFARGATYSPPSGSPDLQSIAVANDGYAVVTTADDIRSQVYLYSTQDHTFAVPDVRSIAGIVRSSPSGTLVGLVEGDFSTGSLPAPQYSASGQVFYSTSVPASDVGAPFLRPSRPAFDFLGTKMVLNVMRFTNDFMTQTPVYNANPQPLLSGSLTGFVHGVFVAPDGSLAYTLGTQFGIGTEPVQLRTYELTGFTQVGTSVTIEDLALGDASIQTVATPDGATWFAVGDAGLKVLPLP